MTALDVSAFVTETDDSEELREFKAKVAQVAKTYTKRHGWCREVKKALAELGITDEKPVDVKLTTSVGFEVTVKLLPSLLHGKTERQQKQALAEVAGEMKGSSGSGTFVFKIVPDTITAMELVSKPPKPGIGTPVEHPEGYVWRRTEKGRVLHLYRLGADYRSPEVTTDEMKNGYLPRDRFGRSAMGCSFEQQSWSQMFNTTHPPKQDGTDALCERCERFAAGL